MDDILFHICRFGGFIIVWSAIIVGIILDKGESD